MLVEDVLDLGRIDVLTAGDDHVLRPPDDPVVALLVAGGDVAGEKPAVRERRLRRLGVAPVAGEDVRAPHEQLALSGPLEHPARLGVAERDVDVRIRLAGEAALAGSVLGRQAEDIRRRLGQPVALDDLDPRSCHVSSNDSGIGAPPTTARSVQSSASAKPGSCAMKR